MTEEQKRHIDLVAREEAITRREIVLRADRRVAYSIGAVFLSVLLLAVLTFFASVYTAQRESHKFCALLITLDGAYRATPPASQTGRNVASEVHDLVRAYGCNELNN